MTKKKRNPDYVEHGSDRHAALLGLRKAEKDDEPQFDSWALADITMYGPNARPEYLVRVLRQKINELKSKPPVMQSKDPFKPHYAPPIWKPTVEDERRIRR